MGRYRVRPPPAAYRFALSGTVTNSADATPIANAVVVATGTDNIPHVTTTATHGSYGFSIEPGNVDVRIQAPNFSIFNTLANLSGATVVDAALNATSGAHTLPAYGISIQNTGVTSDSATPGVYYIASAYGDRAYRTFDAGDRWIAVPNAAEDPVNGLTSQFAGLVRPIVATSGVAGEVAVFTYSQTFTPIVRITSYKVTCTAPGRTTCVASCAASPIYVNSLVAHVAYLCRVQAHTAVGRSANSAAARVVPIARQPDARLQPDASVSDRNASRNTNFLTLPDGVRGSSSTTRSSSGHF